LAEDAGGAESGGGLRSTVEEEEEEEEEEGSVGAQSKRVGNDSVRTYVYHDSRFIAQERKFHDVVERRHKFMKNTIFMS
jgi:hypothetical protein